MMRRAFRSLIILAGVALVLVLWFSGYAILHAAPPTPFAEDHPPYAPIDPDVLKEIAEKGQTTFIVHLKEKADLRPAALAATRAERLQSAVALLRETADRSQAPLRALLAKYQQEGHVSWVRPYWIFNGIAVTGDVTALTAIASRPEVERIRANRVIKLDDPIARAAAPEAVMWGLQRIGANRVWQEFGITGRGVVVANMDTGVSWTHPALQGHYRGLQNGVIDHNYNWFDVTGTYPDMPGDGDGHGTHTMGIMVGDDGAGNQIGVAPGAQWIAVKVLDDQGRGTAADIHAGFEWILAPTDLNGENPDPTRAPHILSNSWGTRNGAFPEFWDDVAALRAAGIFVVFSAGNRGEDGPGSIGSPASYPHSFSVGATDPNDLIADFSSLGPTFWGEIRPNVTAPGVYVRSCVPGGGYEAWDGTSMAAPHAAGAAALLLEADPSLTPEDLTTFLELTATDLGEPGRDNTYGAGRLDVYKAVGWALTAGKLSGAVYRLDGTPIAGATVIGEREGGTGASFRTTTDEHGRYQVAVPAGEYTVTAERFGYEPQSASHVKVIRGYQSLRDFRLPALPYGGVTGMVRELDGTPLTDFTVEAVPVGREEPMFTTGPLHDPSSPDVNYRLLLPAGEYEIRVKSPLHRVQRVPATIVPPHVTRIDFALSSAPSLLLLDNDVWLMDDSTLYYRRALDLAGYLYDVQRITMTTTVPTSATLSAYDVVIWAAPWSSPGYIDRLRGDNAVVSALRGYLDQGGRLLLSGQDIAYWDGGGDPLGPGVLAYFPEYLHARYVRDNSGGSAVIGTIGEILEGITAELNHPTAYKRQTSPDEIAPADEWATPIWQYDVGDRVAGLKAASGPYGVIYWGFGLEGAGPPETMAQALIASITWLTQPQLSKTVSAGQAPPGATLTYTITIRNTTSSPITGLTMQDPLPRGVNLRVDTLTTTIGRVTYDERRDEILWTGTLPGRASAVITFQADLYLSLEGGTVIRNVAILQHPLEGLRLESAAETVVLAPDLSESEKQVDREAALLGDTLTYTITLRNASSIPADPVSLIDPLPMGTSLVSGSLTGGAVFNEALGRVEWTGMVTATMPGSADYRWIDSDGRGTSEGAPSFGWVDITADGVPISLSDDTVRGPFDLPFPFPFYEESYTQVWVSSNGWLSFVEPPSSQAFNRSLPDPNAPAAMIAAFWDDLNPRAGGQVLYRADPDRFILSFIEVPRFSSGGPYTFQTILYPDGTVLIQYLNMEGERLDEATIGLQDETGTRGVQVVRDADYVHDELALRFDPPLPPKPGEHVISFQVRLADTLLPGSTLRNRATIIAPQELTYEVTARTEVQAPDLSRSFKQGTPAVARPGGVITYTLIISNTGLGLASVTLRDPLPLELDYVSGSARGGVTYDPESRSVLWTGVVPAGQEVELGFAARVAETVSPGTVVTNTAFVDDGVHPPIPLSAATMIHAVDLSRSTKSVEPPVAASGDVVTYTINLVNTGRITATQVSLIDEIPPELSYVEGSLTGGATYDPATRRIEWWGVIPAHGESYIWRSSRDPGGPAFHWIDIREIGTEIRDLADDANVGPFPIGFRFPFYDQTFTEFRLSSNGFITFGDTASDFSNEPLPSPSAPSNLIAIWWDDLNPALGGHVYYWSNGVDTLVVSFVDVMRFGGSGPYTFQAILHSDGTMLFQYLSMAPPLDSATIGIQDATGSEGLLISHEDPAFMEDELAIEILPPVGQHTIRFAARVAEDTPPESEITNTAVIDDGLGRQYTRSATLRVNTLDLTRSRMDVIPMPVSPGGVLTYTVMLRNDGNAAARDVSVQVTLPADVSYIEGSAVPPASYDAAAHQVRWLVPSLEPQAELMLIFQARVHVPLSDETELRAWGYVTAPGAVSAALEAVSIVSAPDLSPSRKRAEVAQAAVHEIVTYTITLQNAGHEAAQVSFVDPLPPGLIYVDGSAWASSGLVPTYDPASRTLRWQGVLPSKGIVTLQFAVRPTQAGRIENSATVTDQYGVSHELKAAVDVYVSRLWLPRVLQRAE